jgi:hypothetical protein
MGVRIGSPDETDQGAWMTDDRRGITFVVFVVGARQTEIRVNVLSLSKSKLTNTFFFAIAVPPHVVGARGSSGATFSRV